MPDVGFAETAPEVVKVQQYIGIIMGLERKMERFAKDKLDLAGFYDRRIETCEQQVGRMKLLIKGAIEHSGQKNIVTPNGTAFIKRATKVTWPEDAELLTWVKAENPVLVHMKTTESVLKKEVTAYIEQSGSIPPTYLEEEHITVEIRK